MQVYWVLKLDDIHFFLIGLIVLGFASIICYIVACNASAEIDSELPTSKWFIYSVVFILFFGLVKTFLPNTQQMATILVLPKIANSKLAYESVGLGTDLVKLARKQVAELAKEKKK
jgi:magnesium-transporting ATPase (P-type)